MPSEPFDLVAQLTLRAQALQATLNAMAQVLTALYHQQEQVMADVNEVMMQTVASVKAAFDLFAVDVEALLTQATPDVTGALDALAGLKAAIEAEDAKVQAALTPQQP